ncbi:hypothetical protein Tco_1541601 [Tanacetum coccineum]
MLEQNEKQQINENEELNKWLDFDDTNYDNHLLNYVLHHQRPGLSKSIDSDIIFDIAGRTLLLGRVEFFLVTGFACGKVIFPKYLDDGTPPFVRRLFPDKLKKLEKKKDGELVQDKEAKGLDIGIFPQQLSLDSNPTTKLQSTDAEMGQNYYRKSYDYLDGKEKSVQLDDLGGVSQDDESDTYTIQDGRGVTVGAKVSGEAMNDADMSAVVHVEETKSAREIVLKNKVESLETKVEKLQLDHDKMEVFFENFKKIRPELVPPTPDAKEDPSDAAIDGEHIPFALLFWGVDVEHTNAVGNPDENEGPNAKEDPSYAATDGEHMDTIGSPDETEEPNAQEPISHVLNTPVDKGDVLMTDAPDTINLAYPPSHESEITSLCGSEKKGDGLDGAKANQEDVPASQNTIKAEGMLSTADNGEVVNEPQLPDSHERNKKKGTLLQDFLPVIGKDGKEIKLEPWTEDLTRDSKVTKTRIHVSKEVLDFFNQVQKPGYRFPWGTGFTVNDKFWQCLLAKDANRKGNRAMDPVDVAFQAKGSRLVYFFFIFLLTA